MGSVLFISRTGEAIIKYERIRKVGDGKSGFIDSEG